MNPKAAKFCFGLGSMVLFLLTSARPLRAQFVGGILSDTTTSLPGEGGSTNATEARMPTVGATQTLDLSLMVPSGVVPSGNPAALAMQHAIARAIADAFAPFDFALDSDGQSPPVQSQSAPPKQTQPSPNPQAPSLGDLGFPPAQTQPNPQEQARLDKRSHMLKIHQRLGLIDIAPLVATVILGAGAGGKSTSTSDRWAHLALGSVTGDLYFMSAYYAIRAPKIPGTQTRGQIRLHKALAWIHGPGMILTPILGAMAFDEKSKGERVHGIASAHGAVAVVTAAAYGLAVVSVSIKF
jgi:hypothetical protein